MGSGFVFTDGIGRPLHPQQVSDHFYQLAFQVGLPPVRLHDLRHGAASLMLAAGVDLKVVLSAVPRRPRTRIGWRPAFERGTRATHDRQNLGTVLGPAPAAWRHVRVVGAPGPVVLCTRSPPP
ncbi:tyrosine-type recombinase/integrase [Nonomuraea sp. NPDC050202]|uniref:tyrosine-type recombinase/integrase n=1 Tax=Nonomuraea sp. NPDC050202 TaxID=3155035 RepID=UPI00340A93B4